MQLNETEQFRILASGAPKFNGETMYQNPEVESTTDNSNIVINDEQ